MGRKKSKYKSHFYSFFCPSLPPLSIPHPPNYFQMRKFEGPSQDVVEEEQPNDEAAEVSAAVPAAVPAAVSTMPEEAVDTEDSGLGGCVNGSYIGSDEFVSARSDPVEEAEEEKEAEQTEPKTVYGFPTPSPVRPSFVQDGAAATVDEPLPRPPSPIAAVRWKKRGKMAVSVLPVGYSWANFHLIFYFDISYV